MDGPFSLTLPQNPTDLDLIIAGAKTPDPALLPQYIALAKEAGPLRIKCIHEEEAAFATERLLTETRGSVTDLLAKVNFAFQKERILAWDEFLDNITACDSLALSERLSPTEYQVVFMKDSNDRLDVRIAAARLHRFEKTLKRRKSDAFESQLLYTISVLKTETAMAAIREEENGAVVFGARSQALLAAAQEKLRLVHLAEDELREERKRQLSAEQTKMAHGLLTRAEVASAIPAYQG